MSQAANQTLSSNGHSGPPVIFIVDDEPMVGELVETIFSMEGWDSRVFLDPQEALLEIGKLTVPPSLLLTDFRMPGMNGMELIQGAKRRFPLLKVVLFSGNVDENIQSEYPLRADAFIRKPFYPQVLLETARRVMNGTLSGTGPK